MQKKLQPIRTGLWAQSSWQNNILHPYQKKRKKGNVDAADTTPCENGDKRTGHRESRRVPNRWQRKVPRKKVKLHRNEVIGVAVQLVVVMSREVRSKQAEAVAERWRETSNYGTIHTGRSKLCRQR